MSVGRWRYSPATLTRSVSSIDQFHTAAGPPRPGKSGVVRRSPLLLDDLRVLMLHLSGRVTDWPRGVAARWDKVALMGFAGAHLRSELIHLTIGDVTVHRSDGLHVRLRSSKPTGRARVGAGVAVRSRQNSESPPGVNAAATARTRNELAASSSSRPSSSAPMVCRVVPVVRCR